MSSRNVHLNNARSQVKQREFDTVMVDEACTDPMLDSPPMRRIQTNFSRQLSRSCTTQDNREGGTTECAAVCARNSGTREGVSD